MTMGFPFEHELEVRFRDCDAMGHVNNAVYLTYLEQARFAFWRDLGGARALEDHGFIVARVECDYRRAAKMGDRLVVRLRTLAVGRSSFTFGYEVANVRTRETVAEARSVQVLYDYAKGVPVPIPDDLRSKLEARR